MFLLLLCVIIRSNGVKSHGFTNLTTCSFLPNESAHLSNWVHVCESSLARTWSTFFCLSHCKICWVLLWGTLASRHARIRRTSDFFGIQKHLEATPTYTQFRNKTIFRRQLQLLKAKCFVSRCPLDRQRHLWTTRSNIRTKSPTDGQGHPGKSDPRSNKFRFLFDRCVDSVDVFVADRVCVEKKVDGWVIRNHLDVVFSSPEEPSVCLFLTTGQRRSTSSSSSSSSLTAAAAKLMSPVFFLENRPTC